MHLFGSVHICTETAQYVEKKKKERKTLFDAEL